MIGYRTRREGMTAAPNIITPLAAVRMADSKKQELLAHMGKRGC
jgi:hypothetical protein